MRKLTFERLKSLPEYKPAHKVYYKKYIFCVRLKPVNWKILTGWKDALELEGEVKRWLKKNKDIDCRTRFDCHLAIYIKDLQGLEKVYNKFKKHITTIEAPINDKHQDTMIDDLSITVREKLFHREYRYKVSSTLYKHSMHEWDDLISTCIESFDEDAFLLNKTLRDHRKYNDESLVSGITNTNRVVKPRYNTFIPYRATGSIYLKEYDDLCTLHLMFKDIITDSKKVVLKSELE